MNGFESFVLGGGQGRECGLDGFLDSWHTADLVKSVLGKLVATDYPGMLKNLKSKEHKQVNHQSQVCHNDGTLSAVAFLRLGVNDTNRSRHSSFS